MNHIMKQGIGTLRHKRRIIRKNRAENKKNPKNKELK